MSTATIAPTGTWNVDAKHSRVGFSVKHLGIATVRGTFKEFEGTLEIDDDSLKILGDLTIKGVTNEVELLAELGGTEVDPWGNDRVGLEAVGRISRDAFGIKFNIALGSGNVAVGDKVTLTLDISAVK